MRRHVTNRTHIFSLHGHPVPVLLASFRSTSPIHQSSPATQPLPALAPSLPTRLRVPHTAVCSPSPLAQCNPIFSCAPSIPTAHGPRHCQSLYPAPTHVCIGPHDPCPFACALTPPPTCTEPLLCPLHDLSRRRKGGACPFYPVAAAQAACVCSILNGYAPFYASSSCFHAYTCTLLAQCNTM